MNRVTCLPILLLSAILLAGPALGAQAPGTEAPILTDRQAEPGPRVIDAETAADVTYWETRVAGTPDDITVRLALGNAYALNGRYEDAIDQYKKVTRRYPGSRPAWNNLGSAYRALGRKSKALHAFKKAVEVDPRYGLAYYNIGVVYDSAGEYDRALKYYGLAFKYDPALSDPKSNPQVVTNPRVFAVLLHNYVEAEGILTLPLEPAYPTLDN